MTRECKDNDCDDVERKELRYFWHVENVNCLLDRIQNETETSVNTFSLNNSSLSVYVSNSLMMSLEPNNIEKVMSSEYVNKQYHTALASH